MQFELFIKPVTYWEITDYKGEKIFLLHMSFF